MLKATELRIGNYYSDGNNFRQITANDMLELFESDRIWINPIPLTEEMFSTEYFEIDEAEGSYNGTAKRFVYIHDSESNNDNDADGVCCHFALYNGKFYYYKSIDLNYYGYLERELKYLHEVQNIIFALTNTELPIKL